MGHYMTYSGLLVLVIAAAVGRLLFDTRHCAWSAIVMPALAVAIALTFTRSAWVGVVVAVAMLFILKDLRLLALLPVIAVVAFLRRQTGSPPASTRCSICTTPPTAIAWRCCTRAAR